jgi:hypothetical protein
MDIIPPTNNPEQDTAAIQAVLDARGIALLCGKYRLARPLVVRGPGRLQGWPHSVLTYSGAKLGEPVIAAKGANAAVHNLHLYCQHRAAGVSFAGVTYDLIASGIRVYDAQGVALELHDCWGGNLRDVLITTAHGQAIRSFRCNSVHYDNVAINSCAALDAPLIDVTGNVDLNLWTNLICESNVCREQPALRLTAHMSRLSNLRFENNRFSGPMVVVHNTDPDDSRSGRNVTFADVSITNQGTARCFVRLDGKTRSICVEHLYASQYLTRSIVEEAGQNADTRVTCSVAFNSTWKPLPAIAQAEAPAPPPSPVTPAPPPPPMPKE